MEVIIQNVKHKVESCLCKKEEQQNLTFYDWFTGVYFYLALKSILVPDVSQCFVKISVRKIFKDHPFTKWKNLYEVHPQGVRERGRRLLISNLLCITHTTE